MRPESSEEPHSAWIIVVTDKSIDPSVRKRRGPQDDSAGGGVVYNEKGILRSHHAHSKDGEDLA
jgi:hypothetical protein